MLYEKHNEWTKRTTLLRRVLLILVSFLLIGVDINASYSLRQFSSKNGLSNSAILSMCQDRHGVIWIGSCDGLNIYDGTYLGLYKPTNVHHSFPVISSNGLSRRTTMCFGYRLIMGSTALIHADRLYKASKTLNT